MPTVRRENKRRDLRIRKNKEQPLANKGKCWNAKIETMPKNEMANLQLVKLKKQLQYNYKNSLFYRNKFQEGGLKPEAIRSIKDLQAIPLTTNTVTAK